MATPLCAEPIGEPVRNLLPGPAGHPFEMVGLAAERSLLARVAIFPELLFLLRPQCLTANFTGAGHALARLAARRQPGKPEPVADLRDALFRDPQICADLALRFPAPPRPYVRLTFHAIKVGSLTSARNRPSEPRSLGILFGEDHEIVATPLCAEPIGEPVRNLLPGPAGHPFEMVGLAAERSLLARVAIFPELLFLLRPQYLTANFTGAGHALARLAARRQPGKPEPVADLRDALFRDPQICADLALRFPAPPRPYVRLTFHAIKVGSLTSASASLIESVFARYFQSAFLPPYSPLAHAGQIEVIG